MERAAADAAFQDAIQIYQTIAAESSVE
jgi:hypothetical protein